MSRSVVEDFFSAHGICVDYSVHAFDDRAIEKWNRMSLLTRVTHRLRSTVWGLRTVW